jgi:hypothetical protein
MEIVGLAWLSISGIFVSIVLISWCLKSGNNTLLNRSLIFGAILCILDLIVELIGTTIGKWEYLNSSYFISETVPIELLPIFFSLGLILTFVHYGMAKVQWEISLNAVFIFMLITGMVVYFIRTSNSERVTLLMISVPLALWGLTQISNEKMKALSLLLATLVAIIDYVVEIAIMNGGNYGYAGGFRPETPLTYAMVTIAIFGALERFGVIDDSEMNSNHQEES